MRFARDISFSIPARLWDRAWLSYILKGDNTGRYDIETTMQRWDFFSHIDVKETINKPCDIFLTARKEIKYEHII